jgi:hypothetical protein
MAEKNRRSVEKIRLGAVDMSRRLGMAGDDLRSKARSMVEAVAQKTRSRMRSATKQWTPAPEFAARSRIMISAGKSVFRVGEFNPAAGFDERLVEMRERKRDRPALSFSPGENQRFLGKINIADGGRLVASRKEPVDFLLGKLNGQHAAIEHVLPENAGKTFSHDNVNVIYLQRPRRVFARGPAPEICTGDDNTGPFQRVALWVKLRELEVFEQMRRERLLGHLGEVFCRNDLVRIDVRSVKKQDRSAECFHD